jgi:predicted RNase H-like HicB family nuclease
MRIVNVIYHQEGTGWWADTPDAPSFFAAGNTRDEVRREVREHLPRVLDGNIDEFQEAEFTMSPVLVSPTERKGEWGAAVEGFSLSWFGACAEPA